MFSSVNNTTTLYKCWFYDTFVKILFQQDNSITVRIFRKLIITQIN